MSINRSCYICQIPHIQLTLQQKKFPLLRVPDLDADARGDRTQPVCGDPAVRPEGLFLHLHAVRQLILHHRCGGVPFHHPDPRGHLLLPEDLGPGSSGHMEGETWQQTKAEAPRLQEFCHHVCGFCPLRHLLGSSEFHWSPSGLRPRQHGTHDPRSGLFVASYYMAYFNSCLNAIIYGLLNQNFRQEYRKIIVSLCTTQDVLFRIAPIT
uniref:Melatonin receptor 1a n=1 Tax=Axis axis TaxID=30531 RepID=A0A5P9VKV2_AXIAX|nr:melatonin receptor 1a [Axis axis]